MTREMETAAVIMAAGRGSRMQGYEGNKTLLPLIPVSSAFQGRHPILHHILENLPAGPKALIVHHCREDVVAATREAEITYCHQPVLNGTGGALLAAAGFLRTVDCDNVIITMGDVPFVEKATYRRILAQLADAHLVVLGFRPLDKKQYGLVEMAGGRAVRIVEWKYWKDYPNADKVALGICNGGIYAARRESLLRYMDILASRPQQVRKVIDGREQEFDEFFLTDLVAYMAADGLSVGCVVAQDEAEIMGVDDVDALGKAQQIYGEKYRIAP